VKSEEPFKNMDDYYNVLSAYSASFLRDICDVLDLKPKSKRKDDLLIELLNYVFNVEDGKVAQMRMSDVNSLFDLNWHELLKLIDETYEYDDHDKMADMRATFDVATHFGFNEKFIQERLTKKKDYKPISSSFTQNLPTDIKQQCLDIIYLAKIHAVKKEKGISCSPINMCAVFNGEPGVGKTVGAQYIYEELHRANILTGNLIIKNATAFLGEYVGHTGRITREILDSAKGGLLLIDEAYRLTISIGQSDYAQDALIEILTWVEENYHDSIVILAGYSQEIQQMLLSNPGLQSRFPNSVNFKTYSLDDFYKIFKSMLKENSLYIEGDVKHNFFKMMSHLKKKKNFSNAREVRNLVDKLKVLQARRIMKMNSHQTDINLSAIHMDDFIQLKNEVLNLKMENAIKLK
jgi:stage V sporulation protein K